LDQAGALADRIRARRGKVVFTAGAFDLLHAGHVRFLRDARARGDALIVAVSADASVRAHAGPDRPVNPQRERAELVLALESVDAAILLQEDSLDAALARIRPESVSDAGGLETDEVKLIDKIRRLR
jgi:rfaE bifunctional protein nucleotidyltransferase chain/domain